MKLKHKMYTLVPVALGSLIVSGCGGSSNSSSPDPVDNDRSALFFNDQAGYSFADSLGGRLSRMFSVVNKAFESEFDAKRTIRAVETETASCSGGGSIAATIQTDDVTGDTTSVSMSYSDCIEGGDTSNGSFSITGSALSGEGDTGSLSFVFNDLQITGSDSLALDGQIDMNTDVNGDQSMVSLGGAGVSITADGETISFSNYSLTAIFNETTEDVSLAASMTVQSSIDGTFTLLVDPAFAANADASNPVAGKLIITHSDGSSLTIDANTGDPETFSYIVNENGVTTSGTAKWDETELDLS